MDLDLEKHERLAHRTLAHFVAVPLNVARDATRQRISPMLDDDDDITIDGVALLEELRAVRPVDDDLTIDGSVLTAKRWTPPASVATESAVRVTSGRSRLRGSAAVLIAAAIAVGLVIVVLALAVVRPADQPEPSIVATTSVEEAGQ